jgi:hypothetical protein
MLKYVENFLFLHYKWLNHFFYMLANWFWHIFRKNLTMDEVHDIHGLRLVVEKEEDCYRALDVVHKLWPQVDGRFKDYISRPKLNGYRSLHTVVMSEGDHPFEVQIRTKEMHLQAEYGFAAHWRYKEGSCRHSFVLQMVEWARWVLTWQCEALNKEQSSSRVKSETIRPPCPFPLHSEECPYSYTRQCNHDGPLFVILLEHDKVSLVFLFDAIACAMVVRCSYLTMFILFSDVCPGIPSRLNRDGPDGPIWRQLSKVEPLQGAHERRPAAEGEP